MLIVIVVSAKSRLLESTCVVAFAGLVPSQHLVCIVFPHCLPPEYDVLSLLSPACPSY